MRKFRTFLNLLTPHVASDFPLPDAHTPFRFFELLYSNVYANRRKNDAVFSRNRRFFEIPLEPSTPTLNRKDVAVLAARAAGPRMVSNRLGLLVFHSYRHPNIILVGISSEEELALHDAHEILRNWARTGSA